MGGREALAFAVSHVRKVLPLVRLTDREADDIVQNALLATLVRRRMTGGEDRWRREDLAQSLRIGVTRALGEREGGRLADATARHRLRKLISSEEGVLGRRLNTAEVDEMADNLVEESIDLRTRPVRDFHRAGPEMSLDDPAVARRLGEEPAPPVPDSSTDYLEDELLSGLLSPDDARRRIWNHLAERSGVPAAPQGLVSQRDCDAAAVSVRARGGACAAAHAWLSVQPRERDINDALFTPWPFATEAQRVAVAEFLEAQPRYGDGLWESARSTARSADPRWVTPSGRPIAVF